MVSTALKEGCFSENELIHPYLFPINEMAVGYLNVKGPALNWLYLNVRVAWVAISSYNLCLRANN